MHDDVPAAGAGSGLANVESALSASVKENNVDVDDGQWSEDMSISATEPTTKDHTPVPSASATRARSPSRVGGTEPQKFNNEAGSADAEKDDDDDDEGDFTAEVLERELAALIDSALDSSSAATPAPLLHAPLPSSGPSAPEPEPQTQAQPHPQEQTLPDANTSTSTSTTGTVDASYLAGLAAVLQAAQALQGGEPQQSPVEHSSPTPAPAEVPSDAANAQTAQEAEADLTDFIAQLTAHIASNNGKGDSGSNGNSGGGGGAAVLPVPVSGSASAPQHYPTPPPTAGPSRAAAALTLADLSDDDSPLSWDEIEGGSGGESEVVSAGALTDHAARRARWAQSPQAARRRKAVREKDYSAKGQGLSKAKVPEKAKAATQPTSPRQVKPKKDPKQHVCALCGKVFGRPSDLARHGAIHSGVRPFACAHPGCGKSFIQRSALHVHLRTHTGEKPHACEYPCCGATFGDSSSLARHRRTHAGARPYVCSVPGCGKGFTRRGALTAHMRTHDPGWEPDPNVKYSFKSKPVMRVSPQVPAAEVIDVDADDDSAAVESLNALISRAGASLRGDTSGLSGFQTQLEAYSGRGGAGAGAGAGIAGVAGGPGDPAFEAHIAALSAEIAAAIVQAQMKAAAAMQVEEGDDEEGEDDDDEDEDDDDDGEVEGAEEGREDFGRKHSGPDGPSRAGGKRGAEVGVDEEGEERESEDVDEEVFSAAAVGAVALAPSRSAGPGSGPHDARIYTYPPPRPRPHPRPRSVDSGREDEEDFPAPLRELKRKRLYVD